MTSWQWFISGTVLAWIVIQFPALLRSWASQGQNIVHYSTGAMAGYDQFILFGDSLFQHSSSQERGFSLASAVQAGTKSSRLLRRCC